MPGGGGSGYDAVVDTGASGASPKNTDAWPQATPHVRLASQHHRRLDRIPGGEVVRCQIKIRSLLLEQVDGVARRKPVARVVAPGSSRLIATIESRADRPWSARRQLPMDDLALQVRLVNHIGSTMPMVPRHRRQPDTITWRSEPGATSTRAFLSLFCRQHPGQE